ncbi:MAG: two-component system response regulator BaeR, partial [Burkholderiales bacterium PBB4]
MAKPTAQASASTAHILVVEDDAAIADMLSNYLHMHGYITTVCGDGLQAVEMARTLHPALIVLDLMLPGQDGMAVCAQVRAFSSVPIIMVTARVDEIDRLLGLDTGADDYVCKPFSPREVVARIKALLRRAQGALAPTPDAAPPESGPQLEMHEESQTALWQGHALPLTAVEFRLLRLLLLRPQRVFARAE